MLNSLIRRCKPRILFSIFPTSKSVFVFRCAHQKYLSTVRFEELADNTLDSLHEYFEDLFEKYDTDSNSDIFLSSGVLTVNFGSKHGTYVINKQTPNLQLWLSSPTSGPKRYDYIEAVDSWIYRHNNQSLHQLLQQEVTLIFKADVNFFRCLHSGKLK